MKTKLIEATTPKAAIEALGSGFTSSTADINGTTIHYVHGGSGPALLLIHGFPQDWSEYRHIMPKLAEKFTVIAPDLRGIGGSRATETGYDNATGGRDLDALMRHLKLKDVYVVGHDMGGGKAYNYARDFTASVRGLMILDVPIAGLAPWDQVKASAMVWQFKLHQMPDNLAETLLTGRQAAYFRSYFRGDKTVNPEAFSEGDVLRFSEAYASAASLRAGMEYYRAFPEDEKINAAQTSACDIPIVLAGGDHSFGSMNPMVAEALKAHGCSNVVVDNVTNAGHYVVEDQPEQVLALIEKYAAA